MTTNAVPAIDLLMVADWAETIDGKLYLMGGGFTALVVDDTAQPCRFAVAAVLTVPTGYQGGLPLDGWLEDSGGQRLDGWGLHQDLTVRAPTERPGSIMIAGPVEVRFPTYGEVVVRVSFGDARRSTSFRTVPRRA